MNWLLKIKYYVSYPYNWYKYRQMMKKRLEELRRRDPFIYK